MDFERTAFGFLQRRPASAPAAWAEHPAAKLWVAAHWLQFARLRNVVSMLPLVGCANQAQFWWERHYALGSADFPGFPAFR